MKRPPGRIKDYVEPQAFDALKNFAVDSSRAVAAYRFTDATSELVARWLNALADANQADAGVSIRGASSNQDNQGNRSQTNRALAGGRGVGKSHTLATFAALVAQPELRTGLTDAHVATSARRLAGKRFTVARIERGAGATLQQEVAHGLANVFGGNADEYLAQSRHDITALLHVAASRLYDASLVLVIDTAYGRASRVERNDGELLSELAAAASATNTFIAVALDDDITGAEGANVSLAQAFRIDYLDAEHLFKIAETHVLRKTSNARPTLHEFYLELRQSFAGFNWSESRFVSLYPLHPLVADVTSAVRLYAPTFALLPFAAESTARALARPPLSLVTLNEVFDCAESELKSAHALESCFAAFAELMTTGINNLPVMSRLEARLILKALFVLSLDGRGATASEICAALLLDDAPTASAHRRVSETLARFQADAAHGSLICNSDATSEKRFCFRIETAARFEDALNEVVAGKLFDERQLEQLLNQAAHAHFQDWFDANLSSLDESKKDSEDLKSLSEYLESSNLTPDISSKSGCDLADDVDDNEGNRQTFAARFIWRGTLREGRFVKHQTPSPQTLSQASAQTSTQASTQVSTQSSKNDDWCVYVFPPHTGAPHDDADNLQAQEDIANFDASPNAPINVVWHSAALTTEERRTLERLAALQSSSQLFEFYGEHADAALTALQAQVERLWTRVYLDDAKLFVNTVDNRSTIARRWTAEAKAAATLSTALAMTLDEFFADAYAHHPAFVELLSDAAANSLITELFSGANVADAALQHLAATFAAPLGLVNQRAEMFTLASGDELLRFDWVRATLALIDAAEGETVSLAEVAQTLNRAPYGFDENAQRLILAALVAARRLEFITTNDDRISRRTLATSIDWGAIAGIARPAAIFQSTEELTAWAQMFVDQAAQIDERGASQLPLTGNSISDTETRANLRDGLAAWLAVWHAQNILARFAELPDAALTTRASDLASAVSRSFNFCAEAIDAALAGEITLEEGLQRVADAFINSPAKFTERTAQLRQLALYVEGFAVRDWAHTYLLAAEQTGDPTIDAARLELLAIASDSHTLFDETACLRFDELWHSFHPAYVERYAARHDAAQSDSSFDEAGDDASIDDLTCAWRGVAPLAALSIVNRKLRAQLQSAQMKNTRCTLDVRRMLETEARCFCDFRLTDKQPRTRDELEAALDIGKTSARRTLLIAAPYIASALDTAARRVSAEEHNSTGGAPLDATRRALQLSRINFLNSFFKQGGFPTDFSSADAELIERALAACISAPPPVRVALPIENNELLTPDELHARLTQWLDELPRRIAVIEIAVQTN